MPSSVQGPLMFVNELSLLKTLEFSVAAHSVNMNISRFLKLTRYLCQVLQKYHGILYGFQYFIRTLLQRNETKKKIKWWYQWNILLRVGESDGFTSVAWDLLVSQWTKNELFQSKIHLKRGCHRIYVDFNRIYWLKLFIKSTESFKKTSERSMNRYSSVYFLINGRC